jgi:hypothetical protein
LTAVQLAEIWLNFVIRDIGSITEDDENLFIAGDTLDMAIECPEKLWDMIKEVLKHPMNTRQISALGVGPLEELLKYNGLKFIDDVLKFAKICEKLCQSVHHCWGHRDMPAGVREKLENFVLKNYQ